MFEYLNSKQREDDTLEKTPLHLDVGLLHTIYAQQLGHEQISFDLRWKHLVGYSR
jgi:hypothetical protein